VGCDFPGVLPQAVLFRAFQAWRVASWRVARRARAVIRQQLRSASGVALSDGETEEVAYAAAVHSCFTFYTSAGSTDCGVMMSMVSSSSAG